jgi:hypothetical protein
MKALLPLFASTLLALLLGTETVVAQQNLPEERELTINVNGSNALRKPYTNYPAANSLSVKPDGAKKEATYVITPDAGYHLCREIKRDLKFEGAVAMFRSSVNTFTGLHGIGTDVNYKFVLVPDPVFKKTSSVSGTITVLEVKDPVASKCPYLKDSFPVIEGYGPSIGWVEASGSVEGNSEIHTSTYLTVSASQSSFPNGVYCTHKYIIDTADGENGSMLVRWTMKDMSVMIDAVTEKDPHSPVGVIGGHIGASLFVKFVAQRDNSCTEVPPPDFQKRYRAAKGVKSADGSIRFVMPPQ